MCRTNGKWLFTLAIAAAFVLLLTVMTPPAPAQFMGDDQTYPPSIFRDGSLDARMSSPADLAFSNPGESRDLTFEVTGHHNADTDVLLLIFQDDQWYVIKELGTLGPGETKTFVYTATFNYTGKSNETNTFALLGKFSSRFTGRIIRVHEDWSA
jgi:hypothetical protein